MEEKRMRGVHSAVDEIRRNVFTEVARLAYEGGDLKRVDMIPYTIVPGEVARHRHDVFLERAIVQERVRLALGMSLQPAGEQTPVSAGIQEAAAATTNILRSPWSISSPLPAMPAPPSRSGLRTAARAACPILA